MTFRGFDTLVDAQTFKRFLIEHNFTSVTIERDDKHRLYKVHFNDE